MGGQTNTEQAITARAEHHTKRLEKIVTGLPEGVFLIIRIDAVDASGELVGHNKYSELEHLKPVCGHLALPSTCGHAVLQEID
jgi:hypothetical protein